MFARGLVYSRYSGSRSVFKQLGAQGDGVGRSAGAKDFAPWMRLDHGEFELGVVWIHLPNLVTGRRPEHFDDLDELVNARIARENWLSEEQLGQNATC